MWTVCSLEEITHSVLQTFIDLPQSEQVLNFILKRAGKWSVNPDNHLFKILNRICQC
jgi:hypothetical protein